ncbi:MAG: [FeFe] hydrogenase H-cluster radical SAM maturase HydE [Treponema sp.]|nr:[FeFe] hydrogenase H-cluster radical SAM maturase HydE [Treponema sp.]
MFNNTNDTVFFNDDEIIHFIKTENQNDIEALFAQARKVREEHYGKSVFIRGLIEFTNHCKCDCYYCGIRCSNTKLERFRLSLDEILNCCRTGDRLGLKTFVLQGGEDPWFSTKRVTEIVSAIRQEFPDHAITLSIGERHESDYELFSRAGVNRYLLRHETADEKHYALLHPPSQNLADRKRCLWSLKKIGFQVGAGFMVGSPHQTPLTLLADIRFLEELQPQMVGIGPFIPQKDTPFSEYPHGNLTLCLKMLAITRILLPKALIPATTAMGSIAHNGRELALKAGANVVMPNLSPPDVKKLYAIYDNKAYGGPEAAENLALLKQKIINAGYEPDMNRGDAM